MMLDVYIGELNDPKFQWDGGDWNGNIPSRKSPMFPFGHDAMYALMDKIENGAVSGKQVDWAGWVAKMLPAEIETFLDEIIDKNDRARLKESFPWLLEQAEDIRAFIRGLEPTQQYALVGIES